MKFLSRENIVYLSLLMLTYCIGVETKANWWNDMQDAMQGLDELQESIEAQEKKELAAKEAVKNADINDLAFQGSAKELLAEFDKNSILAEDKYMFKAVKITGSVGTIDDSLFSDNQVSIPIRGDEYGFENVTCYKSRKSDVIYNFNKGDFVTVQGIIQGESRGISLARCHFWSSRKEKWIY